MTGREERVAVVSAFVYSNDGLALTKRSSRMGTYPGKWSAFSGYVERLSLDQALVEMKEEAGLCKDDVLLQGIGIPVEVDDEAGGMKWLVFPFLFELKEGVSIRSDWESQEIGWFKPEEVANLDTVPRLVEILGSLWPPFGDRSLWDGFAEIATNRKDGATELARKGMRILGAYLESNWDTVGRSEFLRVVRAFAAVRSSMGVFPNLASRLLLAADREGGQYNMNVLIVELLEAVDDAAKLSSKAAADELLGFERIFTLSYSETVLKAIMDWKFGGSTVVVAESAPGMEGLYLAESLADAGVNVEIVADADIEAAVEAVDAVLVGCDSINDRNEIQNKVNTHRAVMAANAADIPAYAVAQTFKITPPGWPIFLERHAPVGQDSTDPSAGGKTIFDLTPFAAFKGVLCEEGYLTIGRIAEIRKMLGSVELLSE